MKRRSIHILAALALLLVLFTSAARAAEGLNARHTHQWRQVSRTESTCAKRGRVVYRCRCGETRIEALPAKGHAYGPWKVTVPPTCEQEGTRTHVCADCGRTEARTVEALGHDWDEGRVTRPAGLLEEGVILYTCRNDPAHTRTEALPVRETGGRSVMDGLRNIPPDDNALYISQEPEGGFAAHGGTLVLTVAAAGGTEPYTYEWHRAARAARLGFLDRLPGYLQLGLMDCVVGDDSPVYEAAQGIYEYYCIVRDAENRKATSQSVLVRASLYIALQPENTSTCEALITTLTCRAAGGMAPYIYTWFNSDGVAVGQGSAFHVEQVGEYYCRVEDTQRNTVKSNPAIVYDADPFEVAVPTDTVRLREGKEYELRARVYGGIDPYTGVWRRDGKEIPTRWQEGDVFTAAIVGDGSRMVEYTFLATDKMDDTATATVRVYCEEMEIVTQPADVVLPGGGRLTGTDRLGVTGRWFIGLGGTAVELDLKEDGTYALTAPGAAVRSGAWTMDGGFLYMDGASEPDLAVRDENALMTSDESIFLTREKPFVYAPADPAENTPAELFAGYWKAAYTDVGGTPVPARLLGDETDLYIEGSSAILGGPTLGDTQVKLKLENGALTSDIEGVKVRMQLQADGCLRLTVIGNESAPQTWYMALARSSAPEGENQ